jgi:hypothetical protein
LKPRQRYGGTQRQGLLLALFCAVTAAAAAEVLRPVGFEETKINFTANGLLFCNSGYQSRLTNNLKSWIVGIHVKVKINQQIASSSCPMT